VPTAGIILLLPDEGASPRLVEAKRRARSFLREARRHGVRCVPGTDAVHGNLAFEQQLLVECGWSPQETLKCSTRDPTAFARVRLVMQEGRIVREDEA
jgi:imidazolonepropionase-like amidohydrolase